MRGWVAAHRVRQRDGRPSYVLRRADRGAGPHDVLPRVAVPPASRSTPRRERACRGAPPLTTWPRCGAHAAHAAAARPRLSDAGPRRAGRAGPATPARSGRRATAAAGRGRGRAGRPSGRRPRARVGRQARRVVEQVLQRVVVRVADVRLGVDDQPRLALGGEDVAGVQVGGEQPRSPTASCGSVRNRSSPSRNSAGHALARPRRPTPRTCRAAGGTGCPAAAIHSRRSSPASTSSCSCGGRADSVGARARSPRAAARSPSRLVHVDQPDAPSPSHTRSPAASSRASAWDSASLSTYRSSRAAPGPPTR